jgi:hypothetical protein
VGSALPTSGRVGSGRGAAMALEPASPHARRTHTFQFEKHDGSVFEFRADDALGLQAEAVAVKAHGALEVVDPDGNDSDFWFHGLALAGHLRGRQLGSAAIPISAARG